MKKWLLLLFLFSLSAFGQNIRIDGTAQGPRGPIPGAIIAVCTQPANTNTTPCSPLASLCSSLTDSVCASPNPIQGTNGSTDSLGNYHFYIPAASVPFTLQFYGPQVSTPFFLPDQGTGSSGGGAGLLPSDNIWTGTNTFPSINETLFIDGVKYPFNDAGVQQALNDQFANGGGIVFLPKPISGSSTLMIKDNVSLVCPNNNSVFIIYSGTGVGIDITNGFSGSGVNHASISGCGISVTNNAATGIEIYGQGTQLSNLFIDGNSSSATLIHLTGDQVSKSSGGTQITNSYLFGYTGIGITTDHAIDTFISNVQSYAPVNNTTATALSVDTGTSGLYVNGYATGSGIHGLVIKNSNQGGAYGNVTPWGLWFNQFLADETTGGDAFLADSSLGSLIVGAHFADGWFAAAGINSSGGVTTSAANCVHLSGGQGFYFGAGTRARFCAGNGFLIDNSNVSLVTIDGATIDSNNQDNAVDEHGIYVTGNMSGLTVQGSIIGNVLDTGGHQVYGIKVSAASASNVSLIGNDLSSNQTGAYLFTNPIAYTAWANRPSANNQINANTVFSGLMDISLGSIKLPTSAGFITTSNGQAGYELTNNNWHFWVNGADHLMVPLASGFNTGDCAQPTNSGGTWFLADTGSPCGSGGSGATLQTNGVNNTSQVLLNHQNTSGAGGITFANPSGGIETATLNNTATTVNGQTCTLGSTCTVPFQTGGIGNTSQAGVNFIASTTNVMGITITHSNPGTNQEKAEATGTVNATSGGTGQDTHTATGVAQVNGGTWSVSTALANGTTATTQAAADNSTKVATDAFVLQNSISNPMTTTGDMIVATTSGVPARLAVNTTAVPEVPVSVSSGTSLQPAGISVNTQSGTTYPVAATDRASLIITGNASPVAVSLSQAGTSGFASNFPFGICNSGAGTTTVTPTTSIVNIFSLSAYTPSATSLPLSTGQCSFWYSDNTNYDAILFGANSGGANVALSNLSGVNINTSLLAQTGVDLGSSTKPFRNLFLFGSGTYGTTSGEFTSTPTAARTWTIPDASFTFAGTNLAETFSALQTFGTNISIGGVTAAGATGTGNVVFATSPSLTTPNLGTPSAVNLTNATSLPCAALPALTGNVTTSAGSCATTVAAIPAAAVPAVTVTVGTSSPVTVSTTLNSVFYYNQDATAGTAITYNLPTAAAGKQFCFANSNNGSAPDTGVLTIATSATGQFIIFTDGTLSATGGNVTSGGAAADAACVVGVDSTHWQLYTQVGTWTKH